MYENFAYVYDRLMCDVDYVCWADYIQAIFREKRVSPSLLLDLGCGTGSFCIEMAQRGYDIIGIDLSTDMLSCAREKTEKEGLDILYLNQDMSDFELYGTVDAVVCLLDSINYITDKRDVKRMFKRVSNYLNPGGLFVFDINSPYKLENVLGENVFYSVDEDVSYIWQNRYNKKKKLCEFDLTFFVKLDESYKRYDEIHHERAYSRNELEEMLHDSGLRLLEVYGDLGFSPPAVNSERIFFVCKK